MLEQGIVSTSSPAANNKLYQTLVCGRATGYRSLSLLFEAR
jgi:hypothetical protein